MTDRPSSRPIMMAAVIAAALLASGATPARSEESGPGLPAGMIFPIRGDSVRLDVARVTVDVPRDDSPGRVISSYRLRNLGTRIVDLEIGFARGAAPPSRMSTPDAIDSLRLRVNRRPIPFRMEATTRIPRDKLPFALPDSLPAWELRIPAFETADIDLTYPVTWSTEPDDERTSRELDFHAAPAMPWSGPVDDFSVSFIFDELTAALLRCPPDRKDEAMARKAEKREKDEATEPCVESTISPAGYEWFTRGPGWRFRDGRIPPDFRIRFEWREEEEDD